MTSDLFAGLIVFLAETTAGLRIALVLFAVMTLVGRPSLLAEVAPDRLSLVGRIEARRRARILQRRAWTMMAWAVLGYSPAHAAWLLGTPWPRILSATGDVVASTLACCSFAALIAARGSALGLSIERVRRGMAVNAAVTLVMIVVAWISR